MKGRVDVRRVLITGANGFVAAYLVEALKELGDDVVGVDVAEKPCHAVDRYYACNLMDAASVRTILESERPDAIVHLAAVSSVGRSWNMPVDTFVNNTGIFLNVVEAVRSLGLKTRVLSVGSSEEYGDVPQEEMPLAETHPLVPGSPYAVARVAQEELSRLYAKGFGADIVMTRSFNQFGPGQRLDFFVPSMVRQILDGRGRGGPVDIKAGDLSVIRDFLDVRDAVSAYVLLLEKGVSGEVYNVCSGRGRCLREVLETAARLAGVELSISLDPSRVRPADSRMIVGDSSKLRALGWSCTHTFESTLRDMMEL